MMRTPTRDKQAMSRAGVAWTLLMVCVMTASTAMGGTLSFTRTDLEGSTVGAQGKAAGDIDGDGYEDLVFVEGEFSPSLFAWYEYPTWTKYEINPTARDQIDYIPDVQIVDIDDDGDMDIVLPDSANGTNKRLLWFENPGNPKSAYFIQHEIWNGNTEHIKDCDVADFDQDGKIDIVLRMKNVIYIFFQDSPTNWTHRTESAHYAEGMAAGDISGDGYPDVIFTGKWIQNPQDRTSSWTNRSIDGQWYNQGGSWQDDSCRVAVADINGDGVGNPIFSQSERSGFPISWYSSSDPEAGGWVEHQVAGVFDYCHTLYAGDIDYDGDQDILAGTLPTASNDKVSVFINQGGGSSWQETVAETDASYIGKLFDMGADGDLDIFTSRNYDNGPLYVLENQLDPGGPIAIDNFTYIEVDNSRQKLPDDHNPLGLAMGDLTSDGLGDIASGRYFYRNPGGDMSGSWTRVEFSGGEDATLITDVDNDAYGDIIACKNGGIYWLEATDTQGSSWSSTLVGSMEDNAHGSGQGYAVAEVVGGGKPELVFSGGSLGGNRFNSYYFIIPTSNPEAGNWTRVKITGDATEDGLAMADVDGDGDLDYLSGYHDGYSVKWWENPGDTSENWTMHDVNSFPRSLGGSSGWPDVVRSADLDGDNDMDMLVSRETSSNGYGRVFWYENGNNWTSHTIYSGDSVNSMDVADMDNDGDIDVVLGEHRGAERLIILENDGSASFTQHQIDSGKEHHLGTRVADLDGDCDHEIVSIAWFDTQYLHLWRNDESGGCGPGQEDDEAPTTPGVPQLDGEATAEAIPLIWTASADNVTVAGYRVYRDGGSVPIGTTPVNSYLDETVSSCSSYNYSVKAYDAAQNDSEMSGWSSMIDTPAPVQDSDFDDDNDVDIDDVMTVASNWLETSCGVIGDLDSDGDVDLADFSILCGDYGWVQVGPNCGLVANCSFEDGDTLPDNWSDAWCGSGYVFRDTTMSFSGGASAKVITPSCSGDSFFKQDLVDVPPEDYTLSAWMRTSADASGDGLFVRYAEIVGGTNNWGTWDSKVLSTDWSHASIEFTTTSQVSEARLDCHFGGLSTGTGWFDDVVLISDAPADTTSPTIPTGLAVTGSSSTTISLGWTASSDNVDVLGYSVYRDGGNVGTTSTTTFVDQGLSPETAYMYRVRAFDQAGNQSGLSDAAVGTTGVAGADWWDTSWNYRAALTATVGSVERQDKPMETAINFTSLLSGIGAGGSLIEDSLRVIETDSGGTVLDAAVPFQFDKDADYDPAINASGTLVFILTGTTSASSVRYYDVYFDVTGTFSPATVTEQVTLTDNVTDESQSSYMVETNNATYYYHKQGAGFSSIVDANGNDWINHHPTGGSSGNYRGIPNMVDESFDDGTGYFHPGATTSTSSIVHTGPIKATVYSVSNSDRWECMWEFYPDYARMTVTKSPAGINYWFLYEGTPGGSLDTSSDYCVRSSGSRTNLNTSWTGDLAAPEWVYFEDTATDRYLYLVNEPDDSGTDSYWQLNGEMTVFGFARDGMNAYFTGFPRSFTLGLADDATFSTASTVIEGAYQPTTVTVDAVESQ